MKFQSNVKIFPGNQTIIENYPIIIHYIKMEDKRHLQNSRKIRNLEKMIKNLHKQKKKTGMNIQKKHLKNYQETEYFQNSNYQFGEEQKQIDQNLFLSEQQEMEYHIFTQTVENLENLIESNEQKVQGLQKKNYFLMNHLQNIKKMFKKSQNQVKPNLNINRENFHTSQLINLESPAQINKTSQNPVNYEQQTIKKSLVSTYIKNSEKIIPNKKLSKQSQIQDLNNNLHPNKTKTSHNNYHLLPWRQQQQNVKNFLNTWLKKNVQQHDQLSTKMIQKRIVLLLYMKWKELQNLQNQNNLTKSQILQIITNEMKATFNCICTLKGYEGISFVKRSQNSKMENIQSQKIQQNKKQINFEDKKVQQNKQDLEQEFSFDIQCEENKKQNQSQSQKF